MCWDIHNAVEQYHADENEKEISLFKKFLEEDYGIEELTMYL